MASSSRCDPRSSGEPDVGSLSGLAPRWRIAASARLSAGPHAVICSPCWRRPIVAILAMSLDVPLGYGLSSLGALLTWRYTVTPHRAPGGFCRRVVDGGQRGSHPPASSAWWPSAPRDCPHDHWRSAVVWGSPSVGVAHQGRQPASRGCAPALSSLDLTAPIPSSPLPWWPRCRGAYWAARQLAVRSRPQGHPRTATHARPQLQRLAPQVPGLRAVGDDGGFRQPLWAPSAALLAPTDVGSSPLGRCSWCAQRLDPSRASHAVMSTKNFVSHPALTWSQRKNPSGHPLLWHRGRPARRS